MGKTEIISSKIRSGLMVSTLSTLTQYSIAISSQSNKVVKRNKRGSNRKEDLKLSIFADGII
jgi:hypothetical protein